MLRKTFLKHSLAAAAAASLAPGCARFASQPRPAPLAQAAVLGAQGRSLAERMAAEPLVAQTLIIQEGELQRLTHLEDSGVSLIRPVALPAARFLVGNNRHLGWPVGIQAGSVLLCAWHQTLRHHGGERYDETSSLAVVSRSTDGGVTWSDPIDMRRFGVSEKPMVLGFGNCFGAQGEAVFFATNYGLYRSVDQGINWQLMHNALTREQTGHDYTDNFGPRMIVHPERGLVIPVGVARQPFLDLYSSADEGRTWAHERVAVSETIHPLEPTALYHNGHLIFLSRNHTLPFQWHQTLDKTQRPCMMVSDTGWFPMKHQAITNISSYRWPDTTDLIFNPVVGRYEAVVTNRSGGVGDNETNQDNEQTVNLWSLSAEDLYAGRADQWRFEATLLRLKSGMRDIAPNDIDAAHPGGSAVDLERGVQHIFIYSGRFEPPVGVYRITRSLDTPALARAAQAVEG